MNSTTLGIERSTVGDPSRVHATRKISRTKRSVWWLLGVAALVTLPVQSASSQGPLRRLGERIRERMVEPLGPAAGQPTAPNPARRLIRPLQPGTPAVSDRNAPLPDSPRVRVGRPPLSAAAPGAATTGQLAAPGPGPAGTAASQRSANFNRAAATSPSGDASRVEQSSAWEQRSEYRSQIAGATPGPVEPTVPAAAATEPPRGARLGVVVDTPLDITRPGLPPRRPRGAMVTEVLPQSPAAVAGLRVGDLIVAAQGRVITSVRDLVDEIGQLGEGDELRLQYSRDNSLGAVAVRLAGPDGLALEPAERTGEPGQSVAGEGSILGGLGSMFGGLLGGQGAAQTPRPTPTPAETRQPPPLPVPELAPREPAATPGDGFLETLPAPAPEPQ